MVILHSRFGEVIPIKGNYSLNFYIHRTDWWLPEAWGGGVSKVGKGGQEV